METEKIPITLAVTMLTKCASSPHGLNAVRVLLRLHRSIGAEPRMQARAAQALRSSRDNNGQSYWYCVVC